MEINKGYSNFLSWLLYRRHDPPGWNQLVRGFVDRAGACLASGRVVCLLDLPARGKARLINPEVSRDEAGRVLEAWHATDPAQREQGVEGWRTVYRGGIFAVLLKGDPLPGEDDGAEGWLPLAGQILEAVLETGSLGETMEAARMEVHGLLQGKERAMQSQKLEAVGQLVVGLTHEINNKLGPILIYTQLAQMDQPGEKLHYQLEVIESNTLAIRDIIESLANFAHPQQQSVTRFSINQSLFSTVKMLKYRFESEGAEYRFDLDQELPQVLADRGQLELVFLNVASNALDALKGREGAELVVASALERGQVVVRFSDNGPGISDEIKARLFEPFFSTKELGHGTGLGLSSAYGIVRAHGGDMRVENREGGCGVTFVVELPILARSEEEEVDARRPVLSLDSDRVYRILLVDDDQPTLNMIRAIFCGTPQLEFDSARDGMQARRLLDQTRFDLVLCDLKMPRLGGRELYNFLLQRDPEAAERIIFMTGDQIGSDTTRFLRDSGVSCLTKPFSVEEISRRIISGLGLHTVGEP
jgi:signal transduction histidine kinase/ActR/RegA family two-component response regulator